MSKRDFEIGVASEWAEAFEFHRDALDLHQSSEPGPDLMEINQETRDIVAAILTVGRALELALTDIYMVLVKEEDEGEGK